ncbi:hypothetical protein UFOVP1305_85 [uncultured Caudovirales phage]|uniref:Uncharacterized protein n=1 Tax=uncultured Caudovirales phage TaxID=2100421 RepID=A0A6J5RLZ6_9CAUD|nr:hypothetical protein UFOVP896_30 [uncultured Caudovirales phage]CAB4198413.1 hypothetical protein UFOVP1305_85 [uncultured Caudovirales phage]
MVSPLQDEFEHASALITAFIHGDEIAVEAILEERDTRRLCLALAQFVWTLTVTSARAIDVDADLLWQRIALIHLNTKLEGDHND